MKPEDETLNPYAAPPAGKHIPLYRRLWHATKKAWRKYRESMREDNIPISEQLMVYGGLLLIFAVGAGVLTILALSFLFGIP